MPMLSRIHALLATVGRFLQCPLLLVIRLYWGWQFVVTGWAKLTHFEKTVSFFGSLNIPTPKLCAAMAASTECLGGLLLVLGLFSRFASFSLICVMCVALWTADRAAVTSLFSDPDKFFATDPFLFLYASVLIFAFGPGKISIDALIHKDEKA